MNEVVEVEEIRVLEGSRKVVWRWLFSQPPIAGCPSGLAKSLVHRMTSAVMTPRPDVVTRIVVARSEAYALAGCHEALCDYAACRDLWNAMHKSSTNDFVSHPQ